MAYEPKKRLFKALCYPKSKDVPLEALGRLALVDGKKISKGSKVHVREFLWSQRCQIWVVIVEVSDSRRGMSLE